MKILVINGPNLNILGIREPDKYGKTDYKTLVKTIKAHAKKIGVKATCFQSNSEGEIITEIQLAYKRYDGIIINAGGFTHTSVAILDALKAVAIPTAEVHITDIKQREEFRNFSYISLYSEYFVAGKGINGYLEAMDYLKSKY